MKCGWFGCGVVVMGGAWVKCECYGWGVGDLSEVWMRRGLLKNK